MIGTGLLKVLASYFGFPIFLTIAFVLLIFWFCRFFRANEVLRLQDPDRDQNIVRARGLNLGPMTAAVLLFLIIPVVNGLSEEECTELFRKHFKKLKYALETCTVPSGEFYALRNGMCTTFPVEEEFCYSLNDMIPVIYASFIILIGASILYFLLRKRHN